MADGDFIRLTKIVRNEVDPRQRMTQRELRAADAAGTLPPDVSVQLTVKPGGATLSVNLGKDGWIPNISSQVVTDGISRRSVDEMAGDVIDDLVARALKLGRSPEDMKLEIVKLKPKPRPTPKPRTRKA